MSECWSSEGVGSRETAVQARYVVNSRKHSYYTFCCSVSPDSVSRSLSLASLCFPLFFLRFSHPSVSCFCLSHTHSHIHACVHVQSYTHFPLSPVSLSLSFLKAPDFPCPLPPSSHSPQKVPRCSKLSCISLTATTFASISCFLLPNCAHSWITPHPHMYSHTHPQLPLKN